MSNLHLKVKIHTLSDEAIYIRRLQRRLEKNKAKIKQNAKLTTPWQSLQDHRRQVIRREARSSFLAYGFLRGRPITVVEQKCRTQPDWRNVEQIVSRFTTEPDKRIVQQKFEQWKQLVNIMKQEPKVERIRVNKKRTEDHSQSRPQDQADKDAGSEGSAQSAGVQG